MCVSEYGAGIKGIRGRKHLLLSDLTFSGTEFFLLPLRQCFDEPKRNEEQTETKLPLTKMTTLSWEGKNNASQIF